MQSKGAELPPAVRIALTGQYLIEASAGTGKTWTLTGIVLRLLIEGKRLPEHIIATTFTRAAAADIRKRIHERLEHFHEALLWLSKIQADTSTHATLYPQFKHINVQTTNSKNDKDTDAKDIKISAEQRQARLDWLEEQAHLSGSTEIVTEPINSHLIEYLLDHAREYPLADAIRRCKLVLITLDKLFVGTLDSLSQKWLSEYSAETGYQQGVQISDNEQVVIESIIHDAVRAHHSHLYYQQPKIYELMQHTGRLTTPADHIYVAQKSLQFISTPIEGVDLGEPIDFAGYQQALTDFIDCDLTDIAPYFDKDYRKAQGMTWNAGLATKAERIGRIQTAIQKNGHLFFVHLDDETQKFYDALPLAFLTKEEGGKGFNKNKEVERQTFIHLPSIQALKAVHDFTSQIEQHLDALIDTLNRDIALQVRQKLPAVLEQRRETTFSLQMVRLNQALTGKQGERLARYIRHHYPIALIDESQDINGEQARMIERIYLTKSANKRQNDSQENKKSREFLLLVGDPKQAIYGFRGGDVANYNAMKTLFDAKQRMSLNINRRSNERLITALNHWFGRPSPVDDSQLKRSTQSAADHLAQLGKGIYYQHITAFKTDVSLSWQQPIAQELSSQTAAIIPNQPVSVIHLPANKDAKHNDCELTALHIAALLASGQTLEGRALKPSDIGVLGRRKKDLKQVEDMLSKLGVPTLETAERNVFDTPIASDLAALLEVMIRPQRRDIMNRVLTSHFYQLSLDDVQLLMLSADDDELDVQLLAQSSSAHSEQIALKRRYQDFQNYIKTAARQWQNNGILSALHYLFSHNPMNKKGQTNKNIWVALAEIEDGARHLMDLRHLLDILAQHGMHIGEHELLAWYKKNMNSSRTPEWAQQQPLPTESGVQLMTIHKSKGLEFPVVYVIGMDSASPKAGARSKHNLFLYDHTEQQKTQRRLSTSKGIAASQSANGEATKESTEDYYAQFETDESYEEMRRLAYVAFTRASEQLYMVLGDVSKNQDDDRKPCAQWLNGSGKSLELPERLQDYIGWLAYDSVESNAHAVIKASKEQLTTLEPKSETTTLINYDEAYAQIQARYFKGWAKTSFTALSRQLGKQTQALAIFDDSVEDDLDITDGMTLSTRVISAQDNIGKYANDNNAGSITSDNIRFRFVKGANAGTFLHEIFEKINFTDNQKWSAIIDQSVRHYQLPLVYTSRAHQQHLQQRVQSQAQSMSDTDIDVTEDSLPSEHDELMVWIGDVLAAPLLASGQPLQAIAPEQRIAELGFNMGLSEHFEPDRIDEVFKQYLPLDADKHIEMSAQYSSHIYRYLRGEIDLVYEHAGKYYVVDYKSNYLGNSLSDYSEESLSRAMSKAGYWLQAAIYQVALHRFLRLRINDYNGREEQYLGAVEYVFLRGIDSQGVHDYGRIKWQIPFALVQALDEMFGSPSS
ncbi:UvrD-helicase domain-containing protein [Psychrobacter sp. DM4]|uniref:UvrD-helicase domain-containing protein n=1 Tax=Psychrobacter sp. DM4 TaxID=3440637 RepID=UPI003F50AFD1